MRNQTEVDIVLDKTNNLLRKWLVFNVVHDDILKNTKSFFVGGKNGNVGFILTTNDDVYSFGDFKFWQDGNVENENVLQPKRVVELCGKKVIGFAFFDHVLAFTETGTLYSWGSNREGQLGQAHTSIVNSPTIVNEPTLKARKIVQVACGRIQSLALTDGGEVFEWGSWSSTTEKSASKVPRKIPCKHKGTSCRTSNCINVHKICQIACSSHHSFALTETGEVYTWGCDEVRPYDDLPVGAYNAPYLKSKLTPVKIGGEFVDHFIMKVVCGRDHFLALSVEGKLFAWGNNRYGQLGLGHDAVKNLSVPRQVPARNLGRVVDVAASAYCDISSAINDRRTVFMWGKCKVCISAPCRTTFAELNDVFAYAAVPAVTPKFVDVSIHNCSKVTTDHTSEFILNDKETSDFKILIDGRPIYTHKAVFMQNCAYFTRMFEGGWKESTSSEVHIIHFKYEPYRAFLQYLYTGEVKLPTDGFLELIEIALYHCVEKSFLDEYQELLKGQVSINNVGVIYTAAKEHSLEDLKKFCLLYASRFLERIVRTEEFRTIEAIIIKEILEGAAIYH